MTTTTVVLECGTVMSFPKDIYFVYVDHNQDLYVRNRQTDELMVFFDASEWKRVTVSNPKTVN